MKTFDASTGTPVGDPTDNPAPTGGGARLDLQPVSVGLQTFQNPCFWILLGVLGTVAVQYVLSERKGRG